MRWLIGPVSRCRERIAAYRQAGVDLPILNPPIGPDAALGVIRAFARDADASGPVSADQVHNAT